ncbi:conserved hypothetical protein [Catenulispora acidiphila DSM 44928]|uniref:Carbon monoxide dehydrogenase subunit G n=1 Tax=Catenulispora acidiphila (strain DSM 44928 / JCM 14897 / NBRC 102108 / NRRL B-24433 / ID139908) TaxID=479433 RepID=C7PWX3_CATAD|nr:hypothetical protein [Catenulispora acidiphila]ACU77230.1 conserved hypothetical protein [Catenulispora acidiphila DSM 44928]
MAFEVEVPVRHRTMWLAFTDPEKMARAVPGLTVDAVHAVPPADGPEGVAGDVVAGRLKLRVGAGGAGATITYRGTACIAGAEAQKGTLDIAVDAAQARGNGALAGYLRVTLAQAGAAGERTLISVVPELELSGRALEFNRQDWHGAVAALGAAWIDMLAAAYRDAENEGAAVAAVEATEPVVAVEPVAPTQPPAAAPANKASESESEKIAEPAEPAVSAASPIRDESLSKDPLAAVWNGRYEKNRWLPLITALTLFLLIKRRRRHRADKPGADSSFRME